MDETIDQILDVYDGPAKEHDLDAFVQAQDEALWLEMNSSQLNFFLLPALLRVFPDAKYILPIRDPYEWVNSLINHQLSRPLRDEFPEETARRWEKYRELRFRSGSKTSHPPEEKILKDHGLYTLDGYLSYWAEHNKRVVSLVPPSQLLIVRTRDIDQSIERISSFLNICPSSLNISKSHSNRACERPNLLDEIDNEYIESVVSRHCETLVNQFFEQVTEDKL